ncbi:angiomotin [Cyclospora cayetanensis]|uniref:Angiomotin n=1 Tax=Cyclospora cayetanensis TaxID=88456 RepID=A0A6P6S2K9_9EIME|nr:angiomotin [Cyclospora cayetanensis]
MQHHEGAVLAAERSAASPSVSAEHQVEASPANAASFEAPAAAAHAEARVAPSGPWASEASDAGAAPAETVAVATPSEAAAGAAADSLAQRYSKDDTMAPVSACVESPLGKPLANSLVQAQALTVQDLVCRFVHAAFAALPPPHLLLWHSTWVAQRTQAEVLLQAHLQEMFSPASVSPGRAAAGPANCAAFGNVAESGERVNRSRWSSEETAAFVEAVNLMGAGNWRAIEKAFGQKLGGRTNAQLKDKWQNLVLHGHVTRGAFDGPWALT